jgi:AcrR family transcriptional regulator
MSPRKPAVLRDSSGQNLRDHLIATAARLIDERGSADLAVRDIARQAQVADGALYNYFEDKEDLISHALLAHVGNVMASAPRLLPAPGEGTVAENLRLFIEGGVAVLLRVTPAFAGLIGQPKILRRFHALVGGDAAFDPAAAGANEPATARGEAEGASMSPKTRVEDEASAEAEAGEKADGGTARATRTGRNYGLREIGGRGLPDMLTAYLRGEQRLGRVDAAADIDAAASLLVGAIHGQILPRVLFNQPSKPIVIPSGLAARLTNTVLYGIAPRPGRP